jgi:hypothetical protein
MLTVSGVSLYLVKVLLPSSLGLGPLRVKGGAELDEGLLGDPLLLLTHSEGFLLSCEFPLSCKEPLNHPS